MAGAYCSRSFFRFRRELLFNFVSRMSLSINYGQSGFSKGGALPWIVGTTLFPPSVSVERSFNPGRAALLRRRERFAGTPG
jgi:hypothetical protein